MAADTTGHRPTDHLRTTALLEAALDFALGILNEGGFSGEMFSWGAEKTVLDMMQQNFATVRHQTGGQPVRIGRKLCFGDWVSRP